MILNRLITINHVTFKIFAQMETPRGATADLDQSTRQCHYARRNT